MYGGSASDSLENLRYSGYGSMSVGRRFQAERLPPSQNATRCHAMRAHLQVVIWTTLGQTALNLRD